MNQRQLDNLRRGDAIAQHLMDSLGIKSGIRCKVIKDYKSGCPSCDGTGDIHKPDGEYVGECNCWQD